jgi:hypothetical protein
MDLQEIEVVIGKDGQVQIQVRGVQGLQCLEITKELEEALGSEILARIMTPEALEQDQQTDVDQDQHLKASH